MAKGKWKQWRQRPSSIKSSQGGRQQVAKGKRPDRERKRSRQHDNTNAIGAKFSIAKIIYELFAFVLSSQEDSWHVWKRWEDQEGGGKNKAEEGSKEGNVYAQGRKKKKSALRRQGFGGGTGTVVLRFFLTKGRNVWENGLSEANEELFNRIFKKNLGYSTIFD